jgi:hypothetical protein
VLYFNLLNRWKKMNKYLLSLLLVVLAVAVICCDDILETDLSDDAITLRLPANDITQSDSVAVSFWWEELEGASHYELQVVSPDNTNPTSLVLDTLITKTQFSAGLPAGKYEWCVRGVNSGYKTEFICRAITITKTELPTPEEVLTLILPTAGATLTGPRTINFSWNAYAGADKYTLLIETPNHETPASSELNVTITDTQYAKELPVGEYEWCVKAFYGNKETEFTCRAISITKE